MEQYYRTCYSSTGGGLAHWGARVRFVQGFRLDCGFRVWVQEAICATYGAAWHLLRNWVHSLAAASEQ